MAVLGYLAKLKKGLGLAFGAYFLYDFSTNVPYLILYQCTKFQCFKAMADTGEKKKRKTKIQKFEYLQNEKSFVNEIENIFHSF